MKDFLVKCKDMYGIFERIKKINPNYELCFNYLSKEYEIHDFSNKVNSFCLRIVKNELDARVLKRLEETKRENMKKLFVRLEEENEKRSKQQNQNIMDECSSHFSAIMDYAGRSGRDLTSGDIQRILRINQGGINNA
ncbi:MAG: hypothetical protein IJW24_02685 [Clostridia bacterium]|nr:hypothetical protein [Clostridia bacterium]